jgi:mono/diheme cytochrome c family protein
MRNIKLALVLLFMVSVISSFGQATHHKIATTSLAASIASGQKLYVQYCVTCHQADGGGVPNMNPPLINTSYVLGDKTKLIQIVLNGFNEDVLINGKSYSNAMTPHAFMKDKEIADVLTYVCNSFGNKASRVTALTVKNVRAKLAPIR